jgi:hypothetical protein
MKFDICVFFRKSVEKIQVSLKSVKNNGYFTWRPIKIFLSYLAQFYWEWEMFQKKIVEKIKTHVICSVTFLENRAVYEITWKNIIESGRPQISVWSIRIARWIPKSKNTHSTICNTYWFSTATVFAGTRLVVMLYVYCMYSYCCVCYFLSDLLNPLRLLRRAQSLLKLMSVFGHVFIFGTAEPGYQNKECGCMGEYDLIRK